MEKGKFVFQIKESKDVYSEVNFVIDKAMRKYSVNGKIKRFDFDEGEYSNSIVRSGENFLKVKYFESFGNISMNFEIFGNDKNSLEIESELKSGLEKLL